MAGDNLEVQTLTLCLQLRGMDYISLHCSLSDNFGEVHWMLMRLMHACIHSFRMVLCIPFWSVLLKSLWGLHELLRAFSNFRDPPARRRKKCRLTGPSALTVGCNCISF